MDSRNYTALLLLAEVTIGQDEGRTSPSISVPPHAAGGGKFSPNPEFREQSRQKRNTSKQSTGVMGGFSQLDSPGKRQIKVYLDCRIGKGI